MNELLKNYTQEEIEELALKQLANDFDNEMSLKITKINKEYKKHNKKAISKAILNGSFIILFSSIILNSNSNSNIANFGTEDLTNLFNNIKETISWLPESEILIAVYSKLFDGLNYIIDKIGIMGIILATKSFKFILTSIKDTSKSIQLKQELDELNNALLEHNQKR